MKIDNSRLSRNADYPVFIVVFIHAFLMIVAYLFLEDLKLLYAVIIAWSFLVTTVFLALYSLFLLFKRRRWGLYGLIYALIILGALLFPMCYR